MPDHNGARDADLLQRLVDQGGLACRRAAGGAVRPIAPTVPRPIDQDDAMARGQPVAERQPHVLKIAAGAVQQHDWRRVWRAKFQQMQPAAGDLDKASLWRMGALDAANAELGQERERAEDSGCDEKNAERHAHETDTGDIRSQMTVGCTDWINRGSWRRSDAAA